VVTGNVALSLADRQADVAVRLLRPTQPGLVGRKVGEIGIAVYAAGAYLRGRPEPRVSDGFAGHRAIGYVAEARDWPEAKWLAQNATSATVVTRLNSVLGVAAAAADGAGLAVLPCGIGDGDSKLRQVTPRVMMRDIWLVYHRDVQRTPKVRAALALLTDVLMDQASTLKGRG
jgi:DNA-binding transcriptional LysR family regulator